MNKNSFTTDLMKTTKPAPPLDMSRMLLISMRGAILKQFQRSRNYYMPAMIGDFRFVSEINKEGTKKTFRVGIYQNHRGKKVIAKILFRPVKDYHYLTFKNEIGLYRVLNAVSQRLGANKPVQFKQVSIPKLIAAFETHEMVVALIEYVEGKMATTISAKQKLVAYFAVSDYLGFLGSHLTRNERTYVSMRSAKHYIFLYPILLLKAVLTAPKATGPLLRGVPVFLRSIPALINSKQIKLVHRDLHFGNILVSDESTVLIDLQFCLFTYLLHELITTLRYRWKEDDFYKLFLSEIERRHGSSPQFETLFKGLSVNSITHGLTDNDFTKTTIIHWIDFLRWVTTKEFAFQLKPVGYRTHKKSLALLQKSV